MVGLLLADRQFLEKINITFNARQTDIKEFLEGQELT